MTPQNIGVVFWWFLLLIEHVIHVAYFAIVAVLYRAVNGTFLSYQLTFYSIGIAQTNYPTVSNIHVALAVVHAGFAIVMIGSSLCNKKFVFRPVSINKYFRSHISDQHRAVATELNAKRLFPKSSLRTGSIHQIAKLITRASKALFSRHGLFGAESVHFDRLLLLRELIETGLQTQQLHRMTQLLPRLWLIRLYVVLLVINCWSVPILHRFLREQPRKRRILCLCCDAVLDALSSVGITAILIAVYAPEYPCGYGFSFLVWFDDMWITNFQLEFQMMLVSSWADMASRVVLALGFVHCLETMKDLLETIPTVDPKQPPRVVEVSSRQAPKAPPIPKVPKEAHHKWFSELAHNVFGPNVFIVWGFAHLIVHLIAEGYHRNQDCKLPIRPWLSTKPACHFVDVDCTQLDTLALPPTCRIENSTCIAESFRFESLLFIDCTVGRRSGVNPVD